MRMKTPLMMARNGKYSEQTGASGDFEYRREQDRLFELEDDHILPKIYRLREYQVAFGFVDTRE